MIWLIETLIIQLEEKIKKEILRDKIFNIAKNPKSDGSQRSLASMIFKSFDKNTSVSSIQIKNMPDQKLADELHKGIIRQFEKGKIYSPFINNILSADLADIHSKSKFNKGVRLLLCVIDIFSKYAWFIPLKKINNYN